MGATKPLPNARPTINPRTDARLASASTRVSSPCGDAVVARAAGRDRTGGFVVSNRGPYLARFVPTVAPALGEYCDDGHIASLAIVDVRIEPPPILFSGDHRGITNVRKEWIVRRAQSPLQHSRLLYDGVHPEVHRACGGAARCPATLRRSATQVE